MRILVRSGKEYWELVLLYMHITLEELLHVWLLCLYRLLCFNTRPTSVFQVMLIYTNKTKWNLFVCLHVCPEWPAMPCMEWPAMPCMEWLPASGVQG